MVKSFYVDKNSKVSYVSFDKSCVKILFEDGSYVVFDESVLEDICTRFFYAVKPINVNQQRSSIDPACWDVIHPCGENP